jgi:type II secretory pathway component PulF
MRQFNLFQIALPETFHFSSLHSLQNSFQKPGVESQIIFWRQLATLLKAGIPLYRALGIARSECRDARMRPLIEQMIVNLGEGQSFSKTMGETGVFPEWVMSLCGAGESRGSLDDAAFKISELFSQRRALQQKITTALSYPILLLVGGGGVLLGMLLFVIPKFKNFFTDTLLQVPMSTKILFQLSDLLIYHPLILGMLLCSLVAGGLWLFFSEFGRTLFDRMYFKLPLVGPIAMALACARFARILGSLYQSGVPLMQALQLSRDSQSNQFVKADLDLAIASVKDGRGLSQPLFESQVFPPMLPQMLAVGEEAGKLGEMALKTAVFFEEEAEYQLKKYMALLEPLALMVIALAVAFMASAIILPMFKMAGNFRLR